MRMENTREITALPPRTALYPAKKHFSAIVASALVFVAFLAIGVFLYLAVLPTHKGELPIAASRLTLLTATPTTSEGVFYILLSATKSDGFFLALVFLFTFTYFAAPLTRALLALRAMQTAALLCRFTDWMIAGVFSPTVGIFFFLCESAFSLFAVLFAARAASLSRRMRLFGEYQALPTIILLFSHLLHLCFAYAATVFTAALLFLTVRL